MRNEIRRALHAYGSFKAAIGYVFLMLVAGFMCLFTVIVIWQLGVSIWNYRALSATGIEAEAQVTVRRGMIVQSGRGRLQEGKPDFTVTWFDGQGRQLTSPIRFSDRFAETVLAQQPKSIRIKYLPSNPSMMPLAVDDHDLFTDYIFHVMLGLFGTAGAFLGLHLLRRRRASASSQDSRVPASDPVFEITPTEWTALQSLPTEELLRALYARPLAVYRIADMVGSGPARTFEAFREQVSRLPKEVT